MLLIHLANDLGMFYPNHKEWFDHLSSEGYFPHLVDEEGQKEIISAMDRLYGGKHSVVVTPIPSWFLEKMTRDAFDAAWEAAGRPQPTLGELGLDKPLS